MTTVTVPEAEFSVSQQRIVHAPIDGEMTVGGVAGSGKTLAAIHRAAHLCEHTARQSSESAVLFLCYNRALDTAVRSLLLALPPAIHSRIEVRTAHRWCWEHGVRRAAAGSTLLTNDADRLALIRNAMRTLRVRSGDHEVFDRDAQVFLQEIRLIKGAVLQDRGTYLQERLSQPDALPEDDHALIYQIFEQYQQQLAVSGCIDFDDFAPLAWTQRRAQRTPRRYQHVIIDEAQDLSSTQIALARDLARSSVLIIADGQQAIYPATLLPGTLPETPDHLLPTSQRTTESIFAAARGLLPDGNMWPLPARQGPAPHFRRFRWADDEAAFISATVQELLRRGYPPGEIAVLARQHDLLRPIQEQLAADGVPLANPAETSAQDGIIMSTIHAAKGREFRAVLVAGLVEGVLPAIRPEMAPTAVAQELALARRQLYVAMTRARDELWLTAADGTPSRFLRQLGMVSHPGTAGDL